MGIKDLNLSSVILSLCLTILAYTIFFGQCYMLSSALKLQISFLEVGYAVALGSVVTLLPVSIAGLGTREAAILVYMKAIGVGAESALGFSLLVFLTFYVGGGMMGAVAWWIKPPPLSSQPAV